jgi:hypothetical protein
MEETQMKTAKRIPSRTKSFLPVRRGNAGRTTVIGIIIAMVVAIYVLFVTLLTSTQGIL